MPPGSTVLGTDFITLTTLQSASAFAHFPPNARVCDGALVRVYTGALNFTVDGATAPTTTTGMSLFASDVAPFLIAGYGPLLNLQVIAQTGTVKLAVIYLSFKN